jgi:hypothetical protein
MVNTKQFLGLVHRGKKCAAWALFFNSAYHLCLHQRANDFQTSDLRLAFAPSPATASSTVSIIVAPW